MADTAYVVDVGLSFINGLVKAAGATEPHHIGWGTGTTTAATTNTGLEAAGAEARSICTTSQETTTTSGDTYRAIGTIVCATASKAITEVALYTDPTAGTCFMHGSFSAINVSVGDSIQFTVNNVLNQA